MEFIVVTKEELKGIIREVLREFAQENIASNPKQPFAIRKGNRYKCIKDVIGEDGNVYFKEGRSYAARYYNGVLTDSFMHNHKVDYCLDNFEHLGREEVLADAVKLTSVDTPQYNTPIYKDVNVEIINSRELLKRLDISEPTLIRWRKKRRIPYLSIGSAIRYDWHKVLEAINNKDLK